MRRPGKYGHGVFCPLGGKVRPRKVIVFDTEGTGQEGGFICGALYGQVGAEFFLDPQEMYTRLVKYAHDGFMVFAHNLEYDIFVLTNGHIENGRFLYTRSSMLKASFQPGKRWFHFFDSMNLFPRQSVAALGQQVGLPKLEIAGDLKRKMGQGARWTDLSSEEKQTVQEYCTRDCEIVYRAIDWLQNTVNELGGNLKSTIGGSAMDLYRRAFLDTSWSVLPQFTNAYVRKAYYGGRVENFWLGALEHVNVFDKNSLYPYAQAVAQFPHPDHIVAGGGIQRFSDLDGWEGIIDVRVKVPDVYLPLLPYREQGVLFFPYGTFRSTWTIYEFRKALEIGCVPEKVYGFVGSKKLFNPFVPYVDTLYNLKLDYAKAGDTRYNSIKLLLNSLPGRWGLDPSKGLEKIVVIDKDTDLSQYPGAYAYTIGDLMVLKVPVKKTSYPAYVNAFFASQITAVARVELWESIVRYQDDLIYTDTDSMFTFGQAETSPNLGGWRMEENDVSAFMRGPKEYVIAKPDQEPKRVAKGIPSGQLGNYFEYGFAHFDRAVTLHEAINRNLSPATWIKETRFRSNAPLKRQVSEPWEGSTKDAIKTYPYHVSQLREVLRGDARREGLLEGLEVLPTVDH